MDPGLQKWRRGKRGRPKPRRTGMGSGKYNRYNRLTGPNPSSKCQSPGTQEVRKLGPPDLRGSNKLVPFLFLR